jgi:antitoxin component of RelBE/YafQ-DinJ toxin-antitoxin module
MAAKDSGLRIRIERPLREAFLEACRTQDMPAAQVLRAFMREFVAEKAAPIRDAVQVGRPTRRERKQR